MKQQPFVLQKILLFFLLIIFCSACKRLPLPPPVVLFDQGHGQRFLIENTGALDLSILAETFRQQNFEVKSSDTPFSEALLANASTLIIPGPFKTITNEEIAVLYHFIDDGGQLSIMLHIGQPVAQLMNSLGVDVSNGVIHEQANLLPSGPTTDFTVKDLAKHPLTKGLTEINFYGSWALHSQLEANSIAKTSPSSWVDLNKNNTLEAGDAVQAFSVIVTGQIGHGHFIVFADDAIFQNQFINGQNLKLAKNLAAWLKEGSYY